MLNTIVTSCAAVDSFPYLCDVHAIKNEMK